MLLGDLIHDSALDQLDGALDDCTTVISRNEETLEVLLFNFWDERNIGKNMKEFCWHVSLLPKIFCHENSINVYTCRKSLEISFPDLCVPPLLELEFIQMRELSRKLYNVMRYWKIDFPNGVNIHYVFEKV